MNDLKKVLILFGGNSSEHYVSCKSARSVCAFIDRELFDYELVGIDFYNRWFKFQGEMSFLEEGTWKESKIEEIKNIIEYVKSFDVVFPLIHGFGGEDGRLASMFELFGIKYVGSGPLASAICMDKAMTKAMFERLDIPQVPYVILDEEKTTYVVDGLEFPVIVKPCNGGSSIGISKANDEVELQVAIEEAKKYDSKVVVENFIECRELECAVLRKDGKLVISNPGEIKSSNEFYDYDAKYVNEKSRTVMPEDLSHKTVKMLKTYAREIFEGLDVKSLARIDFFYNEERDELYINEINNMPGFTEISMYPKLIESENLNFRELITILINEAYRGEK